MELAAMLCRTFFAVFIINLCLINPSRCDKCDLNWLRLMFMLSCGKVKRSSPVPNPVNASKQIPTGVYETIQYYMEIDPDNPLFTTNVDILHKIVEEEVRIMRLDIIEMAKQYPKSLDRNKYRQMEEKQREISSYLKTLYPVKSGQGEPALVELWEEITDQRSSKNRRDLYTLIEDCCKPGSPNTCSDDLFVGAC